MVDRELNNIKDKIVTTRNQKINKIIKRIEEVEVEGTGKVIIHVERGIIKEWQTVKLDKEK